MELTTVVEASWVRTTEGAADREEFFRTVPKRIPDLTSIVLVKYWFSTADQEPNLRFLMRIHERLNSGNLVQWIWSRAVAGSTTPEPKKKCSSAHIFRKPLVGDRGR